TKKEISDPPVPPEELTEPTVTCEALDCSGSICRFSLRCSVPGTGFGNISYTWRGRDQQWEERSVVLAVVDKSSLDNLGPLRCTARNAVSSRSITIITPGGLCSGSPSDTTELIGAVGGSVTFHSGDTKGNGALWSFGNIPIVTVLFENPPQPIFKEEKFRTRFTVSERGRALTISQLRMEDAGTYSVTIDGKISTFTLRVYRELTEPTVTCKAQDCLDKVCLVSLRCSMTGAGFGNVSYSWTGWGQRWGEGSVVLRVVDKSSLDELEPLTCTARNAISSRSVTVTNPAGLCPAENSMHPPGPGSDFGMGFGIGVAVGVAVMVVILLGFRVLSCKSKGWKKFCLSQSNPPNTVTVAEYTTVYAEVGPSQPHIPNGIKTKPVAGKSFSTIYSLVKRPEQMENATMTGLELI
ncbi:hypothetical protein HGM15179_020668, partial [Zosterops borbonicus]